MRKAPKQGFWLGLMGEGDLCLDMEFTGDQNITIGSLNSPPGQVKISISHELIPYNEIAFIRCASILMVLFFWRTLSNAMAS